MAVCQRAHIGLPVKLKFLFAWYEKFQAGHRTHDNMGSEYEVILPLLFRHYWCREIGSIHHCIKHERDL